MFGHQTRVGGGRSQVAVRVGNMPGRFGQMGRQAPVNVGSQCYSQDQITPPGAQQAWCYSTTSAGPVPLGSGIHSIPTGATTLTDVTLTPIEAYVIEDIDIVEASGQMLVTDIKIGRCSLVENPGLANALPANAFQSAKTLCKLARGATIYPTVGIVFTFNNPTLAAVNVIVMLAGYPVPCSQGSR